VTVISGCLLLDRIILTHPTGAGVPIGSDG
jgi:hypothetical protein